MVSIKEMDVYKEWKKEKNRRLTINNQNWMCLIVGGTGSGKSWNALSLADDISENGFDCKKHLAFTPSDIIRLLNSNKLKKGDIIIADELGVSMSSRDWYAIQNKLLSHLFQTFREMNVGMIATVPQINFIDKSMRGLFHNRIETIKIHRKTELNEVKVYELEYSNTYDKLFNKIPVFTDDYGNKVSMPRILIRKPRQEIIDEYEKMSKAYKKKIREDIESKFNEINGLNKAKGCSICGNTSYIYSKKKGTWSCRYCREEYTKNPYKRNK